MRVRGPSLRDLARRGDVLAGLVRAGLVETLTGLAVDVTDGFTVDDLAVITSYWATVVDDRLVPVVRRDYYDSADDLRAQVRHVLKARNPGDDLDAFRIADPVAELYLVDARNRLVNVGHETWELARDQLLEGFQLGESTGQLRDRLTGTTDLAAPRAEVVARTEAVGASNAGAFDQMRATGLRSTKEWLATRGARTRPSHAKVNGTVLPLDGKFTVGGWPCDRPHDPSLPPGESISCRCTLVFEVLDDDEDEVPGGRDVPGELTATMVLASQEDEEPEDDVTRTATLCGAVTADGTPCQRPVVNSRDCGVPHDAGTVVRNTWAGSRPVRPVQSGEDWLLDGFHQGGQHDQSKHGRGGGFLAPESEWKAAQQEIPEIEIPNVHVPYPLDDAPEESDAVTAAADDDDEPHTGGMIALLPEVDDARRLALGGEHAEEAEELHVTLAYLGDAADWDDEARTLLVERVRLDVTLLRYDVAVLGEVFGVNLWNLHGDEPSVNLAVGGDDLSFFHQFTWRILGEVTDPRVHDAPVELPEQHSPWVPHICLGYADNPELRQEFAERASDPGRFGPVAFDRVRIAFGDVVTDVPITPEV